MPYCTHCWTRREGRLLKHCLGHSSSIARGTAPALLGHSSSIAWGTAQALLAALLKHAPNIAAKRRRPVDRLTVWWRNFLLADTIVSSQASRNPLSRFNDHG